MLVGVGFSVFVVCCFCSLLVVFCVLGVVCRLMVVGRLLFVVLVVACGGCCLVFYLLDVVVSRLFVAFCLALVV